MLGRRPTTDLTFTVGKADLPRAVDACSSGRAPSSASTSIVADPNVVKISVIGVGMRSHAGVAHRMFRRWPTKGINIQVISTSEIKVSVLIAEDYTELAVRALHTAYGLDAALSADAAARGHDRLDRGSGRAGARLPRHASLPSWAAR